MIQWILTGGKQGNLRLRPENALILSYGTKHFADSP
jgi:hypothetical protein